MYFAHTTSLSLSLKSQPQHSTTLPWKPCCPNDITPSLVITMSMIVMPFRGFSLQWYEVDIGAHRRSIPLHEFRYHHVMEKQNNEVVPCNELMTRFTSSTRSSRPRSQLCSLSYNASDISVWYRYLCYLFPKLIKLNHMLRWLIQSHDFKLIK